MYWLWGFTITALTKERNMRGKIGVIAGIISSLFPMAHLRAQLSDPILPGSLSASIRNVGFVSATQGEPLDLVTIPGDADNRMFVATHKGFIRLIKNNSLVATPFLDMAARGFPVLGGTSNDER